MRIKFSNIKKKHTIAFGYAQRYAGVSDALVLKQRVGWLVVIGCKEQRLLKVQSILSFLLVVDEFIDLLVDQMVRTIEGNFLHNFLGNDHVICTIAGL